MVRIYVFWVLNILGARCQDKVKYYHEQLFRSHQMLLMDRADFEDAVVSKKYDEPMESWKAS